MEIYMKNGNVITLNIPLEDVYNEILLLKKKKGEYLVLTDNDTNTMTGAININEISSMKDCIRRKDENNRKL